MKDKLEKIKKEALETLPKLNTLDSIQEYDVKIFGRKGDMTEVLSGMKNLSAEEKPVIGKYANEIKIELETAFALRRSVVEKEELEKSLAEDWIDLSAPGRAPVSGTIHPLMQTQSEVETIFNSMGFMVADGFEVESEHYNFDALNIPSHHPARDMQDTFFLDKKADPEFGKLVLRTHTSPGQIRNMQKYGAPLRLIIPGRVFRNEALDATHEHSFDQVEGLLVDENISIASLKGVMKEFLTKLFKKEVNVRFRPGYFPFVEPGFELDFSCLLCDGKGCRTCKDTGWVEFMGSGMVHPKVLEAGGIDSKKYQGWAFGFGLDRLLMMRYKIEDIRNLRSGDLRFVTQFR
ncbi:MAG: phenylalanine--tRNA ligase subunit alpha [Candidatus Peregrinibacteria bacterium]|nr:phenylalanine--tRNA ligase subunit alpha [Candidatus Peregrinibacteria bacterium]MDZ4244638.1 phenylalanine--tRNA ligase subunit alpha [Candidatus Gracilibacteria bacterium]